jgi:hypothetical protein
MRLLMRNGKILALRIFTSEMDIAKFWQGKNSYNLSKKLWSNVNQGASARISRSSSRCDSYLSLTAPRRHQICDFARISWTMHSTHKKFSSRKAVWAHLEPVWSSIRGLRRSKTQKGNYPNFSPRRRCLPLDLMQISTIKPFRLCFSRGSLANPAYSKCSSDSRLIIVKCSCSWWEYLHLSLFAHIH